MVKIKVIRACKRRVQLFISIISLTLPRDRKVIVVTYLVILRILRYVTLL